MSDIYEPAEDSYLLSDILKKQIPKLLKKNPDLKILEIGSGSGIQLQTLSQLRIKKENIFSSDINQSALSQCTKLGFNCIKSDLFENVKGKFDVIIFNPPYLPYNKKEPEHSRLSTTGGKSGSEIINRFLKQAGNHLNSDGKIFLLTSSLTKKINFKGYKKKIIGRKKLFFEELKVYLLEL
jgi:release factor glutamine methyltransferase